MGQVQKLSWLTRSELLRAVMVCASATTVGTSCGVNIRITMPRQRQGIHGIRHGTIAVCGRQNFRRWIAHCGGLNTNMGTWRGQTGGSSFRSTVSVRKGITADKGERVSNLQGVAKNKQGGVIKKKDPS
jgi:hypothetical protein